MATLHEMTVLYRYCNIDKLAKIYTFFCVFTTDSEIDTGLFKRGCLVKTLSIMTMK